MSTTLETEDKLSASSSFNPDMEMEEESYRAVSKSAVASLALALMGILAFWSQLFVLLPVLAVGFGLIGLWNIRRFPDEITGTPVAWLGLALGGAIGVGAVGLHVYTYATEVPEGFTRVLFYELKPDRFNKKGYTPRAEELDGQQVFIKGYVRPGLESRNLEKFVLTGDFGDCCFGGNPKMTDVIAVRILSEHRVDYDRRLRNIMGTFRLHREQKRVNEKDVPSVVYEIEATDIR